LAPPASRIISSAEVPVPAALTLLGPRA